MALSRNQEDVIKLKDLRSLMNNSNISAYIIPNTDDHMTEFVLKSDRNLAYITGFTGSVGTGVVTENKAALWVDSRYYIQGARQLNSHQWTLMKIGEKGVPSINEWLSKNLKNGSQIGVDPKKMDASQFKKNAKCLESKGLKLVPTSPNLIDIIWKDKPEYPRNRIYPYDIEYAGESWEDKVGRLQKRLKGSSLVVSALDEIAWLTNLRGSDFPFTPVFRSYLILHGNQITLYTELNKVTDQVKEHLTSKKYQTKIEEYEMFWDGLKTLGECAKNITFPSIPGRGPSYHIYNLLPSKKVLNKTSPIMEMKSYKNHVEANGTRNAHIRDSVALCQLMFTLTNDLKCGNKEKIWDEMRVVDELANLRSLQALNKGSSFSTIAAFGPNSALPHYKVTKETNLELTDKEPLTIDSGGQYLDGTIDTTRVIHAGSPTDIQISVYTALLKGVIDLSLTVFPEGTKMGAIDFLARRPLYQIGKDFGHGVVHGTGCFLNVHESYNGTLYENFVGSQEPGYYNENDFGMRLENLMIVVPAKIKNYTKKKLLTFEPLTLVPYEKKFINISQLEKPEIDWLNDYHSKVRKLVGDEMIRQNHLELYDWLIEKTEPMQA